MLSPTYLEFFNALKNKSNLIAAIKNKRQTDKIKEDLIRNLEKKGIKTSFVQVNLSSERIMIRFNLESSVRWKKAM